MAGCHMGSVNSLARKMCTIQLCEDAEGSGVVKSSAMMGLGLLGAGTCNRPITELILCEMCKPMQEVACAGEECFSIACGFGLGLISIGQVTNVDARLLSLLSTTGGIVAVGLICLGKNLHIPALRVPTTFFQLTRCVPSSCMFKTIANSLIFFEKIGQSYEWIQSQIPPLYKENREETFFYKTRAYIETGLGISMGLKYAGTANPTVRTSLLKLATKYYDLRNKCEKVGRKAEELDCLINVCTEKMKRSINGAALELREKLIKRKKVLNLYANQLVTYDTCLVSILLALSLVMAGTGDLVTLRILRASRRKVEGRYGFFVLFLFPLVSVEIWGSTPLLPYLVES